MLHDALAVTGAIGLRLTLREGAACCKSAFVAIYLTGYRIAERGTISL